MSTQHKQGVDRRRQESLVARQARVGIVANSHSMTPQAPTPRDVWTRWPDLRSVNRRKAREAAGGADPSDQEVLNAFVRSVRRAGPAPDTVEEQGFDPPAPSWLRWLLLRLALGGVALVAAFYAWRIVWSGD
ncbi:hypothetical protein ROE7235_00989 [Roseibaca ekhonensis]|jgi:hypothetical protein|uniref:Uncharacterized protein n=1 Tax=Roseinatronobacter ekhonensis TaxID=254356 RepID=A0A3B0M660_9RHOB|nr:hypothetical protein [Roseibaca ekhonensis]SUZ31253.1 hypothetical protein ROE7235_00989 [Roseibaca ekhonensis]